MGDVIAGRFELLEPIARGATGTVWHAWDHTQARSCAAKVLRQRDGADLLRFVREQSITTTHPHLLTPYGWAAEDAHVAIAMPLATGGTVASALTDYGALGTPLVAVILDQVLDGLGALHEAGWVHRDIKPDNLMFAGPTTARPHVLVADFGIALHRDDVRFTRTGMVHGTTGFLAPEILQGEAADPAQDIYATGITALRMLDPDRGESAPGAVPPTLDDDPQFAVLLADMIATDPAQRPTARHARDRIAAIPGLLDGPMLTAGGEPFEVFDHLDTSDGGTEPDQTQPAAAHPSPTPTQVAPVQAAPAPPENADEGPQAGRGHPKSRPARKERRRRHTRGVVAAVLSMVALVAGVALLVNAFPASPAPSDPDPVQPPATPIEETDETDGDDGTGPDGSGDPGDGNDTEDQGPAGDNPLVDEECTWVQENTTVETEAGNLLTCTRQDDGSYAWQ